MPPNTALRQEQQNNYICGQMTICAYPCVDFANELGYVPRLTLRASRDCHLHLTRKQKEAFSRSGTGSGNDQKLDRIFTSPHPRSYQTRAPPVRCSSSNEVNMRGRPPMDVW